MRSLVSDQFKVANYTKTFALKTALTTVLTKLPKVLTGEIQRYGCAADTWAPPQPFYILLEDLCVYTPRFRNREFPITVSTTYGDQDLHDYEISIFHKPTNQTLFTQKVRKREQLSLKLSLLEAFDLSEMVLYVSNTNPIARGDIATIELTDEMFTAPYGGVIKNNMFYFVRKLEQPIFQRIRGDEFGCPLVNRTEAQQKSCLITQHQYNEIPDYFYKNMEQVAQLNPMQPASLSEILRQQEEERLRIRAQILQDAISGQGWGPGGL